MIKKIARNKQQNKAFNIVELMVVIAIIGVLAAVTIPTYRQYTAKARLTSISEATVKIRDMVSEFVNVNTKSATAELLRIGSGTTVASSYIPLSDGISSIDINSGTSTPSGTVLTPVSRVDIKVNVGYIEGLANSETIDYSYTLFGPTQSPFNGPFVWQCTFTATTMSSLEEVIVMYLPKHCVEDWRVD